jgi:hypothetical protein
MATKAMMILEFDHMHTEICQSIYVQVAMNVYHTHAWILYLPLLTNHIKISRIEQRPPLKHLL